MFPRLPFDRVHGIGTFPGIQIVSRDHSLRNRPGHVRQNRLQAADHGLEQADAGPQRLVHVGFDRVLVMQVDDPNGLVLLAEPIDPPDALLHPAWGSTACRN